MRLSALALTFCQACPVATPGAQRGPARSGLSWLPPPTMVFTWWCRIRDTAARSVGVAYFLVGSCPMRDITRASTAKELSWLELHLVAQFALRLFECLDIFAIWLLLSITLKGAGSHSIVCLEPSNKDRVRADNLRCL